MEFGQLIKYNMRKIFLEIFIKNVLEKPLQDSFLKNQN